MHNLVRLMVVLHVSIAATAKHRLVFFVTPANCRRLHVVLAPTGARLVKHAQPTTSTPHGAHLLTILLVVGRGCQGFCGIMSYNSLGCKAL